MALASGSYRMSAVRGRRKKVEMELHSETGIGEKKHGIAVGE